MNPAAVNLLRRGGGGGGARWSAFTLIEMVTSCLVLSLIMLSLGYGLKLALVSTGNGATHAAETLDAADLVERVSDDLNLATGFTERTATAMTFTVPDLDGGDADTDPDQIRYQWWPTAGTFTVPGTSSGSGSDGSGGDGSGGGLLGGLLGTVGGLLGGGGSSGSGTSSGGGSGSGDTVISIPAYSFTRQLNGGAPALVARDVRHFGAHYLTRTMSPPAAADRLLFAYESGTNTYAVNSNASVGVTFLPSSVLPAGTTSFRITRVQFYLRVDALESTYNSSVEAVIWPVVGGVPSGTPTADRVSHPVPEIALSRSLSAFDWVEFGWANPPTLTATGTTRHAVVLRIGSAPNAATGLLNEAATGAYAAFGSKTGTSYATRSSPTGSWSVTTGSSLRYRIYGTTTP